MIPKESSPRISPDISDAISEGKIFRFKKWWKNPRQMINRPWLSVWFLDVHDFNQLQEALDAAHALKCVHSLNFCYAGTSFEGSCVVPNFEIQ